VNCHVIKSFYEFWLNMFSHSKNIIHKESIHRLCWICIEISCWKFYVSFCPM